MKSLVVYYSRTGTTEAVAALIAEKLGAAGEGIISVKNRKGMLGFAISGKEAAQKIAAEIKETKINPEDHDLVIIGTPIWAWNISSPVRAYLEKYKDKFKKVAFFCTMGGSGDKKAFQEMENILNIKPIATLSLTTKEVVRNEYVEKTEAFINELEEIS